MEDLDATLEDESSDDRDNDARDRWLESEEGRSDKPHGIVIVGADE